jgi:hypothetical protein
VRAQSVRLGVAPAPSHHLSGQHPDGFANRDSLPVWRLCSPGPTPLRPPIAPERPGGGTGLLTCAPSPTPCGLGLGPPHPQLISMAAEPWGIRWGGFAPPSRYSCRHSHSPALQVGLHLPFAGAGDAPLPCRHSGIRGFGAGLSPVGLSVPRHHRPVSYYALFEGWLLLGQPPGCLCTATALSTQSGLGDLSRRSGLFPF